MVSSEARTFDPVWEEKYRADHAERYPWDVVVSFVFRNAPRDRPRSQVRILEVGFGTGCNLFFAAGEGFSVAGVEASPTAVEYARARFAESGREGDLRCGDFTELPFPDGSFDLAVNREALCCCGMPGHARALAEVHRVLRPGGRLLYNGYADSHTSYLQSIPGPGGVRQDIRGGSLVGTGQVFFVSRKDLDALFAEGWTLRHAVRREEFDMLEGCGDVLAEWIVVAERR